jgi:hypothetical protein
MPYLGTQPNDVKKNTGLYTPSEILQLTKDGSWGGSLELIAEQNCSGATTLEFTSIKENIYDTHFIEFIGLESGSNMYNEIRVSNDGGTSYETSNYDRSVQYMSATTGGTFGENRFDGTDRFSLLAFGLAGSPLSNNVYLHNLGNANLYSHLTSRSTPSNEWVYFGSQMYLVAETINALQIFNNASAAWTTGKVRLFGIKQ